MEKVIVSGDLHQVQEEVWYGNVSTTIDKFLDGGRLSIENAVDEFITVYHRWSQPVYELEMTGTTYTLKELMTGYLERKA